MINLKSFQTAFFSKSINLDNKLEFTSKLISASQGIFDGEPMILPIPSEVPSEVPRIIIKSKDKKYACNVSLNRIDLLFNPQEEDEKNIEIVKDQYYRLLLDLSKLLSSIQRIGMIANLSLKLTENSNTYILRKYIKKDCHISETDKLQIHALHKVNLPNNIKMNRWLRIMTTQSSSQPDNDKYLSITIDVNSVAEITYEFDERLLQSTFMDSLENMKNLIEEHFRKG